jgi:nitroreductase
MYKSAENQYPIHNLLKERWSPRAFASQPVEEEKLLSLFEAARWSPSGGNRQPWHFIVVNQANRELHEKLVATMTGRNRLWTQNVPTLVVTVAKMNPEMPAANRFAYYDLGQAVAHLTVQAADLGLHVHQMAGYDVAKVRELLEIPDGYEPMTIVAIGYFGKIDDLPEELGLRDDETAPRTRKPLTDFVFGERWNQPLPDAILNH